MKILVKVCVYEIFKIKHSAILFCHLYSSELKPKFPPPPTWIDYTELEELEKHGIRLQIHDDSSRETFPVQSCRQ